MPKCRPIAAALAVLALAAAGDAVAEGTYRQYYIDMIGSEGLTPQGGSAQLPAVQKAREAESIDAAGSKDMQLKGQKIPQNAGSYEPYLQMKLENTMISSYQIGGDAASRRNPVVLHSMDLSRPQRGPRTGQPPVAAPLLKLDPVPARGAR
jgi:hypothetical protein